MKPLVIYLADLTYTTLSLATEAFPLNIGFIGSFCKKNFDKEVEIKFFKYIDDLEDALISKEPDILGISCYPWNLNLGMEFFKMVETLYPSTIRVMGGPNFPLTDQGQSNFMRRYPLVDFYVYAEGEGPFSIITERILSKGKERTKIKDSNVNGVVFMTDDREIIKGERDNRRKALDEIPSPYLTGLMDKFFDDKLSPMLETNRGCPFSCTFCHEGSPILSKINFFSTERVIEELNYLSSHITSGVSNLIFADPNFGMYKRDYEICTHIAKLQKNYDWPKNVWASTGKNQKERIAKNLKILGGSMKLWISVQSMDQTVLTEIKRNNIKTSEMLALRETAEEMGLTTLSELILGLPGDSYERHIQSITKLIESEIDTVTTYTLMLLNGTELNTYESRVKYGINSHFRILPRDFAKLRNGSIAIEIEEVVTATNTLSFEDYKKLRVFHLIVNVAYNGKWLRPLFKFFKEKNLSTFKLLKGLIQKTNDAPNVVKEIIRLFKKDTVDELWKSENELMNFASKPENYEKLINGELGANLIQNYSSISMKNMGEWCNYVFDVAEEIINQSQLSNNEHKILQELRHYCEGLVHNLWGKSRNKDNPLVLFNYDFIGWLSPDNKKTIEEFELLSSVNYEFGFTPTQIEETGKYIKRFGTSDTGVGRIVVKMDITRLWRHAIVKEDDAVEKTRVYS